MMKKKRRRSIMSTHLRWVLVLFMRNIATDQVSLNSYVRSFGSSNLLYRLNKLPGS
jgi:hypothetical protein